MAPKVKPTQLNVKVRLFDLNTETDVYENIDYPEHIKKMIVKWYIKELSDQWFRTEIKIVSISFLKKKHIMSIKYIRLLGGHTEQTDDLSTIIADPNYQHSVKYKKNEYIITGRPFGI